ncbi:MAG: aminoacyl-tRNA hydrolase [Bacillota bacterium]|jgi:PTH1 family peptidyl-tRNA hydrolase
MKLVAGLGNPGPQYRETRHNAGFLVVERLAREMKATDLGRRWHGVVARASFAGEKVYILKPQTYMNLSGRAVAAAVRELDLDIEDILIVYDDLALPLGTLRFRPRGSDGGQKGMRSVLEHLGHQNVPRLRLGIGADSSLTPRDFVLEPFSRQELPLFEAMAEQAVQAIEHWLYRGMTAAMNKYNGPVTLE